MARFVSGMNLSLDGFVDHTEFAPDPILFRHWIDQVSRAGGGLYGRCLYGLMQYWDEDQPGWDAAERDFARAWRKMPKWVVSQTLDAVGPNAVLIRDAVEPAVRRLQADVAEEIDVGGPALAAWMGARGLIDEYRLYYHPVVLGRGVPFFAGPLPRLRILATEQIGTALRVTCAPD